MHVWWGFYLVTTLSVLTKKLSVCPAPSNRVFLITSYRYPHLQLASCAWVILRFLPRKFFPTMPCISAYLPNWHHGSCTFVSGHLGACSCFKILVHLLASLKPVTPGTPPCIPVGTLNRWIQNTIHPQLPVYYGTSKWMTWVHIKSSLAHWRQYLWPVLVTARFRFPSSQHNIPPGMDPLGQVSHTNLRACPEIRQHFFEMSMPD